MSVVRPHPRPMGAARLVPPPVVRPALESAWPWLFWVLWGAWLAVSDLRDNDPRAGVLRLLIGAAVLGFARPSTWWLWSLALAAWVPAEMLMGSVPHLVPAWSPGPGVWLVPALPALAGGLLGRSIARGVLARRAK